MKNRSVRHIFTSVVAPLLFVVATTVVALMAVSHTIALRSGVQHIVEEVVNEVQRDDREVLSPYDDIFKRVAVEYGLDWRLLAAIGYAESEFKPTALSASGAVGIMQIMPYVAKRMGVEREQLYDVEVSVPLAAQLIKENYRMLRFGSGTKDIERLKFVLACYNAGYSRVNDARNLARYHDENRDDWSSVADYLAMLGDENYYNHEVVKAGAFHGSKETIAYVRRVMRIYKKFCRRVEAVESPSVPQPQPQTVS